MKLRKVLSISRPHFWAYEAATFVFFGAFLATKGIEVLSSVNFWVFLLYFLVPANILIYGVNDIFDYETDKHNPKKVEYESLVEPKDRPALYKYIFFTNIPFVIYAVFYDINITALLYLFLFLFFAVFYSAPPIRAKARPFLDSFFSAGHYTVTGVFGYYLMGGQYINWLYVSAGFIWCVAMHAFSAVPDIQADTKANLETIATKLGKKYTIILCIVLYGLAGVFIYSAVLIALAISLVYIMVLGYCLFEKSDQGLFKIYTYFSYINVLSGGLIAMFLIYKAL